MERRYLEQCEQEPLHLSGAIQDHGTLLAIQSDGRINHVAANVADFLGQPVAAWLGQHLPPPLNIHISDMPAETGSRRFLKSSVEGVDGLLDLTLNRNADGDLLLELTRAGGDQPPASLCTNSSTDVFTGEAHLEQARQDLLVEIGEITAAQRVLFYAFYEQGDGEVISEFRQGGTFGSYLGLRFPASDIPRIARMLYLKNPWRLIPDARRDPVPLFGQSSLQLDLTHSDLRSVSPIHRTYLANMGVVGSLSFPVVISGNLTALIAVHHHQPLPIPHSLIECIAERVRNFNFSLAAFRAHCRIRMIDDLMHRFDDLRTILHRHGDLQSAWTDVVPLLQQEFLVDGAVLCLDESVSSHGQCFEANTLAIFDEWFCTQQTDLVWVGDNLIRQIPDYPLSEIAGVLALRIKSAAGLDLRIYLTRCEHIHEVAWGGNPHKPVEFHDGTLGIAPRRSFEKWIETRLGYSRPWENEARLLGLKLREMLQTELRC